jgi:hypothetical protein
MHGSNIKYASSVFYEKRTDDKQYDIYPPEELAPSLLLEGKSDHSPKGSSHLIKTKKTLLLCAWSLNRGLSYRFKKTRKRLCELLDSSFTMYLWQNENDSPLLLTKELIRTDNLASKSAPHHINTLHQKMGKVGISPDELALLDEHSLTHLHDDKITPCIIQLSQYKNGECSLASMLEYVKSLSIDFVCNQDTLSIKQAEWLDAKKNKLAKHGAIRCNYRSSVITDSLIPYGSKLSQKLIGSSSRIANKVSVDSLSDALNIEELNVTSCKKIDGLSNNQAKALVKAYIEEMQQTKATHQNVIPNFRNFLRVSTQMLRKIAHNKQDDCLNPMHAQSAKKPVFNTRLSLFKRLSEEEEKREIPHHSKRLGMMLS